MIFELIFLAYYNNFGNGHIWKCHISISYRTKGYLNSRISIMFFYSFFTIWQIMVHLVVVQEYMDARGLYSRESLNDIQSTRVYEVSGWPKIVEVQS